MVYPRVCTAVGEHHLLSPGKALLPQAEADDDAFQESDRRLCLSLILSGAAMVWLFIALGINGQTDWVNNQAMWLGDHILAHPAA